MQKIKETILSLNFTQLEFQERASYIVNTLSI